MKAIIVDDEKHCRDLLEILLTKHCPSVQILASCKDGSAALKAIESYQPDLVFLDIEMPGMNGFEMLEACRTRNFSLVFTTAYNEYAVKAIRHHALDYLLKPIDKEELMQAVQRVAQEKPSQLPTQIDAFVQYLSQQKMGDRIALPTLEGLHIIQSNEIYYCESDGGYTRFYMTNGKVLLISKTLKEVEEVLDNKGFCRVHHSYLVNVRYVQKYIRGDGGEIILQNERNIPVSRNKKQEFLNMLEKI